MSEHEQPMIAPDEFDLLRDRVFEKVEESAEDALHEIRMMALAARSAYAEKPRGGPGVSFSFGGGGGGGSGPLFYTYAAGGGGGSAAYSSHYGYAQQCAKCGWWATDIRQHHMCPERPE